MINKRTVAAFTLLEVMMAMTLLAIMVVLLFSSLRIGAESWNKGENKIAEVNEKAVVYQFFKRHLPSTRPLWDQFTADDEEFSFQGDRQQLQFVSTFPASAERKGLQLFTIKYFPFDKHEIKVIVRPFYPPSEEIEWQEDEVTLLESVDEFQLSYLARESVEDAGVWQDNWQGRDKLPALVKIKITLQDESFWPEMVIPLRLSESDSNELMPLP